MSTRGSNDNTIALLVFLSVWLVLKRWYLIGGFFFGLSIHFKIYPIIYSFVLYFFIDTDTAMIAAGRPYYAIVSKKGFFTWNRLVFTISTVLTLVGFTALFYHIYGYEFLYESVLYHFVRKDHRHNNSVYFYLIYQMYDEAGSTMLAVLTFLPQWAVVIGIGIAFYYDLFLAMLLQTWFFVIFNKVCTAQYYLWYLTLLPVVLINNDLVRGHKQKGLMMIVVWILGQCFWGYHANNFEHYLTDSILGIQIANYVWFIINATLAL